MGKPKNKKVGLSKSTAKKGFSQGILWGGGIVLAIIGVVFGYFIWNIESPTAAALAFAAVSLTGAPMIAAAFKSRRDWVFIGIFAWLTIFFFSRFIFGGGMLFGSDTMGLGYFAHSFYRDFIRQFGAYPLWEPFLHGGMPFHAAMHGDVLYPTRLLELALPLHYALGLKLILHIWLAGFFMFGFLRRLKLCRGASFFGGLAYMFGPFFTSYIYAGHDGKMFVITLLPLAFWALEAALEDGKLWRYLLFGLTYSAMVFSAHMQMAYFAAWGIGAYFVFRIIRKLISKDGVAKAGKHVLAFVLAIAIGLTITTVQIYPPFKYLGKYSQRTQRTEDSGYAWATSWSLHPEEIGSIFFPEFGGISVGGTNTYWGRNAFKLNSDYFGIIVLMLALGAVILLRSPRTWFFFGVGTFSTIFALGATTPFFRLFYALIPQVKKFRGPSMLIFLAAFSAVVLAAEMIAALKDDERRDLLLKRGLMIYIYVVAVLLLLKALLMTGAGKGLMNLYSSIFYSDIAASKRTVMEGNVPNVIRGMWIAVVVVGAGFGAYALAVKKKISVWLALGIILLATSFDLWRVGKPFVDIVEPGKFFSTTGAVSFLQKEYEKRPFRTIVFPGAFQDSYLALNGLEEVVFGVGHGNQLRTFDEFIDRSNRSKNLFSRAALGLLNADYLAVRGRELGSFPLAYQEGNLRIYKNPMSNPRAFSVYDWREVDSPEDARKIVFDQDFNPGATAVIEGDPPFEPLSNPDSAFMPSPAKIDRKNPDDFEVAVDMKNDGLLVLCENWYPEWHAYDGETEIPIYRAYGTFRAVPLEAGFHKIRFRFEGETLKKSLYITLFSILAWGLLFAMSLIMGRKKNG